MALLTEQAAGIDLSPSCQITGIHYAGDEGGIVCKLDFRNEPEQKVFFASITHLAFDRRLPLAREIAGYQKHRTKRVHWAQNDHRTRGWRNLWRRSASDR
jgi:hypothetical protein